MKFLNNLFSKILPTSKTPSIFLNRDGSVLTWNSKMEEFEGYKENEIVGKKFNTFFSSVDSNPGSFEKILINTSEKGKTKHSGLHFRKDGSVVRGSIILTAIRDEKKETIGFGMSAKKH
jgi:PAS domain S-box-containing protein